MDGLQGVFNYSVEFPADDDTVIIIAPNGYGKTALLSLLKDCVALNLKGAATHTFNVLEIHFADRSMWRFERGLEEERLRDEDMVRYRNMVSHSSYESYRERFYPNQFTVTLSRTDRNGAPVVEELPDFENLNPRLLSRVLRAMPEVFSQTLDRPPGSGSPIRPRDLFRRHYREIVSNPRARDMLQAADPSLLWPYVEAMDCLFIETQRLLYAKEQNKEESDKSVSQEEILRQAERLSQLLQRNYSDYAARSQALDRSFPSRLIKQARSSPPPNIDRLRLALQEIEQRRAALTEAGILVEQTDPFITTVDDILPKVADALQVYVRDSREKLATYDSIYPRISAFRDLMNKKLKPKQIEIGREFGASVVRGNQTFSLQGLSSGEKHEFIMLFKLIFDTKPGSLVLIDEPEISLHVVWQLEFMADLRRVQATSPFQSIIATHSPQIFQGCRHLLVDLADQAA